MTDFMSVLYLCDRKACGDTCPNEDCHHTRQWEHALHKDADVTSFERVPVGEEKLMFVELLDE